MTDINIEKLRERLYAVAHAIFCIGETCVEVSKQHISEKEALSKIRVYLNDAGVWSKFMVDQLIEDCMGQTVTNSFDEPEIEWLKKILQEQPLQVFNPNECDVSFSSDLNTAADDCCMVSNIDGRIFNASREFLDRISKMNHSDISASIERIKKYIKE